MRSRVREEPEETLVEIVILQQVIDWRYNQRDDDDARQRLMFECSWVGKDPTNVGRNTIGGEEFLAMITYGNCSLRLCLSLSFKWCCYPNIMDHWFVNTTVVEAVERIDHDGC